MLLVDVNVLLYAFWGGADERSRYRAWPHSTLASDESWGVSDLVLSSFVRIATSPGPRHWEIFRRLCTAAGTKGNLVADAYLAALAVESGSEWITTDRDFSRFPVLRTRHPFR